MSTQGWKIDVSAGRTNVREVASALIGYLTSNEVGFTADLTALTSAQELGARRSFSGYAWAAATLLSLAIFFGSEALEGALALLISPTVARGPAGGRCVRGGYLVVRVWSGYWQAERTVAWLPLFMLAVSTVRGVDSYVPAQRGRQSGDV